MSEWSLGHVEVLLRLAVQCTHLSYRQVNYTLGSVFTNGFSNVVRTSTELQYITLCVSEEWRDMTGRNTHTQRERTREFQANDRQIKHMDI